PVSCGCALSNPRGDLISAVEMQRQLSRRLIASGKGEPDARCAGEEGVLAGREKLRDARAPNLHEHTSVSAPYRIDCIVGSITPFVAMHRARGEAHRLRKGREDERFCFRESVADEDVLAERIEIVVGVGVGKRDDAGPRSGIEPDKAIVAFLASSAGKIA